MKMKHKWIVNYRLHLASLPVIQAWNRATMNTARDSPYCPIQNYGVTLASMDPGTTSLIRGIPLRSVRSGVQIT